MKRDDLVRQTQDLIDQGDRIARAPSRAALNTWLAASDALLSSAWGQMDRYHQAWLDVGRIAQPLRGRQISEGEEADEETDARNQAETEVGESVGVLQVAQRREDDAVRHRGCARCEHQNAERCPRMIGCGARCLQRLSHDVLLR